MKQKMKNEFPSIMLKCACSTHAIEITRDKEENEWWIAIWEYGRSGGLYWCERFRWIWRILTTGHPFADSVILDKESKDKLAEFLKKNE